MQSWKKTKILYIEDDLSSRMLVKKVLSREPFQFYEASSGLEGLKKATMIKPDLILMDINLPDISGTELTTKIKNSEDLRDIVVVALTGLTNEDAREMTLIAGCDGFLRKPIDVKIFPEQLLKFLEGKREGIQEEQKDYYHSRYEISLVNHLTSKVQELEKINTKLSSTTKRLKDYNNYLEKILSIFSRLQTCKSPQEFKKTLVQEIFKNFKYDRCIFFDVDDVNMVMKIYYAEGLPNKEWNQFAYPFNNSFFKKLFLEKQVLFVPNINKIKNKKIHNYLKKLNINQFIFAYLGIPKIKPRSEDIKELIMPMLGAYLPRLHDQKESDIDLILNHLKEYLASESLYRGGFIFLDNYKTKRLIASYEYQFLETLFRTTSYMYQNIQLMEKLHFLFIRAEKEAITDPLTNLFNYRYLMHQLNREISRNQRHKSSSRGFHPTENCSFDDGKYP